MTQHPREIARDEQVFRPSDLATRWGVSENTVRAEIERGALRAFRIGKLYRIKAGAVEEYECRTIPSGGSEEDSPSLGTKTAGGDGFSLRHARRRRRSNESNN